MTVTDEMVQTAHDVLMAELFLVCQPDRGDVFSFMDDRKELLRAVLMAAIRPQTSTSTDTKGDNVREAGEVVVPHPLASWPDGLPLGLYVIHWKSGGSSEAAIGMQEDGTRWIAPTNWVRPGLRADASEWCAIDRVERITHPAPEREAGEPVGYACTGCNRLTKDPDADLAKLKADGHLSCCPERNMKPVYFAAPEQEAGQPVGVSIETIRNKWGECADNPERFEDWLFSAHPVPEPFEIVITDAMVEAAKCAYWHEVHHGDGYGDGCYRAALRAGLAHPAPEPSERKKAIK